MLRVYLTVDVEVWCESWDNIDERFPESFRRYVHGPTERGNYGLPHQLQVLRDHGLSAEFFVEPLFSTRFGLDPLAEIVGLIQEGGSVVQLHLHPEWVVESNELLLQEPGTRRPGLRNFTPEEQETLIAAAAARLRSAGSREFSAFRAGSFMFNLDTLSALVRQGIGIDASYNAILEGPQSGLMPGVLVNAPLTARGVVEVPMTVFHDGFGRLRHLQLTACSTQELEAVLWDAADRGRESVVVLWHNFELLDSRKTRPDAVVVRRFHQLCRFLDRHRDRFVVCGFNDGPPPTVDVQPAPLSSGLWPTAVRWVEQSFRRAA